MFLMDRTSNTRAGLSIYNNTNSLLQRNNKIFDWELLSRIKTRKMVGDVDIYSSLLITITSAEQYHRAPPSEGITYYPPQNGRARGADSVGVCGFLQNIGVVVPKPPRTSVVLC